MQKQSQSISTRSIHAFDPVPSARPLRETWALTMLWCTHVYYTIPPGVLLTLLYRPLFALLDIYRILLLIAIAVLATIPWDSYLIRNNVWSYPSDAILGSTLFEIPIEEVFFFVIQTYNTSLLYLFLSKPTFHPAYLRGGKDDSSLASRKWLGRGLITLVILVAWRLVNEGGRGFYLGLILAWAAPFILLLWSLAYQFILGLPWSNTILPVLLPTLYLWVVDTLALRRGTWVIEAGTKLGWEIWDGLEIEEALFFLVTNLLIVFGLVAFDNSVAILQSFPAKFPSLKAIPTFALLIQALLVRASEYDEDRLAGFREAIQRLRNKSRSFYLASGVFEGRLRHDLVLLYSFCRVADDLIDNSSEFQESQWISRLTKYLDVAYGDSKASSLPNLIATFTPSAQSALKLLPTSYLSARPFYDLLSGFQMDVDFSQGTFPIKDEDSLRTYAARVAGTVAESCIELVYHHTSTSVSKSQIQDILLAGRNMGIALQLVNIARDIQVDAAIGRVYIPTTWLKEHDLEPQDIVSNPKRHEVEALRQRLLDEATKIFDIARPKIELLPSEARGPMRVAVESYMEIGRTLRKSGYKVKAGRATVPKLRRLVVAWRALRK